MLSSADVNTFGQILDSTWGKSSTLSATMSMKAQLVGEGRLRVIFTSLATFASDMAMRQQTDRLHNEAHQLTEQFVTKAAAEFKERTGRKLSCKMLSSQPSTEIVSLQPHISPRRTAYYRLTSYFEVV